MIDKIHDEINTFKAYLEAKKEQVEEQKKARFHRIMSLLSTILAAVVTVCYLMKGNRATSGYVMSANVAHIGIFMNIAVYFLYKAVKESGSRFKNKNVVVERVEQVQSPLDES